MDDRSIERAVGSNLCLFLTKWVTLVRSSTFSLLGILTYTSMKVFRYLRDDVIQEAIVSQMRTNVTGSISVKDLRLRKRKNDEETVWMTNNSQSASGCLGEKNVCVFTIE